LVAIANSLREPREKHPKSVDILRPSPASTDNPDQLRGFRFAAPGGYFLA
jgi:hypothetical protein